MQTFDWRIILNQTEMKYIFFLQRNEIIPVFFA